MVSIKVSVSREEIASVMDLVSSSAIAELNAIGGRAASQAAAKYHRTFDEEGGWRGKRSLMALTGGSEFGSDVARGWNFDSSDPLGATISNDASYYSFKVTGGTIKPKRAKALTIPLVPEAKGLRASTYTQNTGHKLFTIRGKNLLFERVEGTTTGARGKRGTAGATSIRTSAIRPIYLLLKSVTQPAWPGALPPEDILTNAFSEAWLDALEDAIDES